MVSLVNSHTNAISKRWDWWEIDSRFALSSTPGWVGRAHLEDSILNCRLHLRRVAVVCEGVQVATLTYRATRVRWIKGHAYNQSTWGCIRSLVCTPCVSGLWFRVSGFGFRVCGLGLGFRVEGWMYGHNLVREVKSSF